MNYTFRNKKNNSVKVVEMRMADREPWLDANPDWEQIIVNMVLADPMMLGRLPAEAKDFQRNVIGRMEASIPGNNLKHQMRRFGQTREI